MGAARAGGATPAGGTTLEEIPSILAGSVQPLRVGPGYWLAMAVVACAMLLLPLLYLGIAAAVGVATYLHAVHNTPDLAGVGLKWRVVAYLIPLFVGGVLLVFFVKPLFAPRSKRSRGHVVTRGQEPVLFAFVERLCELVGAPKPRSIEVDCDVNASAGFRSGIRSFLGTDLVLTVGLPLAAGLDLRQLAGVLAHELGHFSQGAGMRFSYVIRGVNAWFARLVYDRDAWDDWLLEQSRGGSGDQAEVVLALTAGTARACIWLTRRVLWLLMMLGHALSTALMRQMEFDADTFEAQVAGSDAFEGTTLRMKVLGQGSALAHQALSRAWVDGELGENFPEMVVRSAAQLPPEAERALRKGLHQSKTGPFDTHPADSERVRAARRLQRPGIVRSDRPATSVFRDFDALARATSLGYYRAVLGPRVSGEMLVATRDLEARRAQLETLEATLRDYFAGLSLVGEEVGLDDGPVAAPEAWQEAVEALRVERDATLERARDVERLREQAGPGPGDGPDGAAGDEVDVATLEGRMAARRVGEQLEREALDHARRRLRLGLELLRRPDVAEALSTADTDRSRASELVRVLRSLDAQVQAAQTVGEAAAELARLGGALDDRSTEGQVRAVVGRGTSLAAALAPLGRALADVPYPFDHATEGVTVGRYLVSSAVDATDPGAVFQAAQTTLQRFGSLQARILGELAAIALRVEGAAGLPDPPAPGGPSSRGVTVARDGQPSTRAPLSRSS